MSSSRIGRPVILAATAAVLLSSCGSVSSVPSGAVAARVGDEEVSVAQVDALAEALCSNAEEQIVEAGQSVPMKLVRQTALNILTLDEVARQVADENGVKPGAGYQRAVAEATKAAEGLPEDQREDYVIAGSIDALLDGVIRGVGAQALRSEGIEEPTEEEAGQRGSEIFWSWPDDLDLEVNPVFDMAEADGQLQPAGDASAVSVAVSATARAEGAEENDQERTAGLPDSLRCG